MIASVACMLASISPFIFASCRSRQTAQVLDYSTPDLVGSHAAGAETFGPLVDEAVGKLLARQMDGSSQLVQAGYEQPRRRICFVGVENRSIEALADFKEQLYEHIDSRLVEAPVFDTVSRRFVEAGLRETRLRPEDLFVPANMQQFLAVMAQQGQPVDCLLFAKLTSGTTNDNRDYQRDYLLTLELVDILSGNVHKEAAHLRKGYNVSLATKIKNWRPFH